MNLFTFAYYFFFYFYFSNKVEREFVCVTRSHAWKRDFLLL